MADSLDEQRYLNHKEATRNRINKQSKAARDIGAIPPVLDPARKEACRYNLALFLETYMPNTFYAEFSEDHYRIIKRLQDVILNGGRLVEAVYRGWGKTTITEGAALWAAIYGHRRLVPLIAGSDDAATKNITSIKTELESNPLLLEDFPEVVFPIHKLEGSPARAKGQTYDGVKTKISWKDDTVILPYVEGSRASQVWIGAFGITSSRARGLNFKMPDGEVVRPDFVIIDDPQTTESAGSPTQVQKRLNIIRKSILRSTGHRTRMAVAMPCTVIEKDDLVDQLLDHTKNPSWEGERVKMLHSWPGADEESEATQKLWLTSYRELREDYDPEILGDQKRAHNAATAFYFVNRAAMDEGAKVAWNNCYDETEISAIQHAMNIYIDDGAATFASECQNNPLDDEESENQITKKALVEKLNGLPRGVAPLGTQRLVVFADIQKSCFYYTVLAVKPDFSTHIVEYDAWPKQNRAYFSLRQVKKGGKTLQTKYPGQSVEGCWFNGMRDFTEEMMTKNFSTEDGAQIKTEIIGFDANDGNARETVFTFCRKSNHKVIPTTGTAVTASGRPFGELPRKIGEVKGLNWRVPTVKVAGMVRHIYADVNYWKSFTRSRIFTAQASAGSMTIYGTKDTDHRMLFEHMVSEYSVETEGRGRKVDEWSKRLKFPDNHLFDSTTQCHILASYLGTVLKGTEEQGGGGGYRRQPKKIRKAG